MPEATSSVAPGPSPSPNPAVRVTVLGSGTSTGVPAIGCECRVCKSDDPRNKRLRSSVLLETQDKVLLVDCGVDFRQQMLRRPTPRLDAVLLTHPHADHVHGLDDLRAYTLRSNRAMPVYGGARCLEDVRARFAYIFNPPQIGGGIARLDLHEVGPDAPFDCQGISVTPLPILHGRLPIYGFRIGSFAYLTDCSFIPETTWPLLEGVETVILTGLRAEPHPTHFSISQSLEAAARMGVRRLWLIHMTCRVDHAETEADLPEWARLTYDGLVIDA